MTTQKLHPLEENIQPYILFWEEWRRYPYNGLHLVEIYALDVHIANEFRMEIADELLFCLDPDLLERIAARLKETYQDYQDWLILRFQTALIRSAGKIPPDLYFSTPLAELGSLEDTDLPFSDPLIGILRKFRCFSLGEIFFRYGDKDFREPELFRLVLEFMSELKIVRMIYQLYQQKGGTTNTQELYV
jgi:hypothetical protein